MKTKFNKLIEGKAGFHRKASVVRVLIIIAETCF